MVKLMSILSTLSFLMPSVLMAQMWAPGYRPPTVKTGYRLINEVEVKTIGELSCEIIILASTDNNDVRILRIDPPSGVYNATYMIDHPELIPKYGRKYLLSKWVDEKGPKVKSLESSVNFKDDDREVIIKIRFADGTAVEKRISVFEDFFKDRSRNCIK